LLCFPICAEGHNEHAILNAPILIVPLADGLFQDGETAKLKRTLQDGLRIPQGLIFDGAGKMGREILRADFSFQDAASECGNQDIHRGDVLLAMSHEQAGVCRRWVQAYLQRGFAHALLCLSMDF
jgi:hypothetical protein